MSKRVRLGMLTPSSNTALEPITSAMVAQLPGVSAHFSRFTVTEISLSDKALGQSYALMVNYLYDLDDIEKNHEAFANQGEVAASGAVRRLIKGERAIFGIPAPSFSQG